MVEFADGPPRTGDTDHMAKARASGHVQSLNRALAVLKCLSQAPAGLTLSTLAKQVQLPASTTHRLLKTLEENEFVRQSRSAGVWQIGPQAFVVGSAFVVGRDLLTFTRPFLYHIRDISGESAALSVPDHLYAIAVQVASSRRTLRAELTLGQRTLLHTSAAGQAMLSVRSDMEIADYFSELAQAGREALPLGLRLESEEKIIQAREQEVAVLENGTADGVISIASPITDTHRQALAAIELTAPVSRTNPEMRGRYIQWVREAAQRLTFMYAGHTRGY